MSYKELPVRSIIDLGQHDVRGETDSRAPMIQPLPEFSGFASADFASANASDQYFVQRLGDLRREHEIRFRDQYWAWTDRTWDVDIRSIEDRFADSILLDLKQSRGRHGQSTEMLRYRVEGPMGQRHDLCIPPIWVGQEALEYVAKDAARRLIAPFRRSLLPWDPVLQRISCHVVDTQDTSAIVAPMSNNEQAANMTETTTAASGEVVIYDEAVQPYKAGPAAVEAAVAAAESWIAGVLNAANTRTILHPIARLLGGIPGPAVRKITADRYSHYTNLSRPQLVAALLATYGGEAVAKAYDQVATGKAGATAGATIATADMPAAPAAHAPAQEPAKAASAIEEAIRQIAAQVARPASEGMDESRVRALVDEILADRVKPAALQVEVKVGEAPAVNVGVQHFRFPELLQLAACRIGNGRRLNVWLWGPPATGKTSAAQAVATALGLQFYFCGAIETAFTLLGYSDAHGRTVRTPFREAWENGGVFLMDEIDASHPNAVTALNAAIDGNRCAFPDGIVVRHPDCIILAGANTAGQGGNNQTAGRLRQDVPFLSRWSLLSWPHDNDLEDALVGEDPTAKAWVAKIRRLRAAAAERKVEGASLTMRASLQGAAILAQGMPEELALEVEVRKGMPFSTWSGLCATAGIRVTGI